MNRIDYEGQATRFGVGFVAGQPRCHDPHVICFVICSCKARRFFKEANLPFHSLIWFSICNFSV